MQTVPLSFPLPLPLPVRPTDKYSSLYGLGGQTYVYHHEEDESSFQLVDTQRVQKPQYRRTRFKFNQVL